MKEQYGEYEIRYEEVREEFVAYKGEERVAKSAKLADLKKRLDRVEVVRGKFKSFKVLTVDSGGRGYTDDKGPRIVEWKVTSVVQGDECWLTNQEDGTRSKERLSKGYKAFVADTPENRTALEGIVKLYKQRDALDSRINVEVKLLKKAEVPAGAETEAA